jgi:hypothetical protein
MTSPVPTQPLDLLRVTVIKKKHASQIREAYREHQDWTHESIEVLYVIEEWNALLCRRKDNGNLLVIQIAAYYQNAQIRLANGRQWSHRQAEIQEQLHHVPQLFLD